MLVKRRQNLAETDRGSNYNKEDELKNFQTVKLHFTIVMNSDNDDENYNENNEQHQFRSSRPEVFCKKGVLRNFAKFTGKHLRQSLFFNKVACNFIKKETLA